MSLIFTAPPLPTSSLCDLVPESKMRTLWPHINLLFFGFAIREKESVFKWKSTGDPDEPLGIAYMRRTKYHIEMTPVYLADHHPGGNRILDMLGTLLHEACHIFFN